VGFGGAIKYGLRNGLVYRGRASRSAYWWFTLFQVIFGFAVSLIATAIAASVNTAAAGVLIAVVIGISMTYLWLAGLALAVRRLHDIDKSGWWLLISLVPLVGGIILLVFTLSEGTPGPNRYDLFAAEATAGALQGRCWECGAETAEAAPVCTRCGAPVGHQPPVADAEAGGPGGYIASPHDVSGQRNRPGSRRYALVIAGVALAVLAAGIAVIAVIAIKNPPTSSISPTASSPPTPSSSPMASASQLTYDQIRPGDCLQVPNINTITTWPYFFTVVSCAGPHTGEVFFNGDIWPQSLAYPGDNPVGNQADARCVRAFTAYDGSSPDQSAFNYSYIIPDSTSWSSGDRSVQCIAYDPGGASIDYPVKGSNR
jgi:uncharacterized membrane protein YhaH (DUF805 family)